MFDGDRTPFVPKQLVQYLKGLFTPQYFIDGAANKTAERGLGFMEGAVAIISLLDSISREDDAD